MTSPKELTAEELDELAELERAATPQPWIATKMGSVWQGPLKVDTYGETRGGNKQAFQILEISQEQYEHIDDQDEQEEAARGDERLIAAARNALPALLYQSRLYLEAKEKARAYDELVGALEFISFSTAACSHWLECDTAQDIVALAKRYGWKGIGGEGE
jgi:hypothetical protein